MKPRCASLCLLLVAAAPLAASAQGKARPARPLDLGEAKFDANHDGVLDQVEREKMKEAIDARIPKIMAALDANHDGIISFQEWKSAYPELRGFEDDLAEKLKNPKIKADLLRKYDADKDGKLDDNEKAQARAEWRQARFELIAKFDFNEDGKLDAAERKTMVDSLKARQPAQ